VQTDTASKRCEEFVRWFLRFNGYFGIENFIVHAADDSSRITDGVVANYTETDTLAVRMPHSREITGTLHVANYKPLIDGINARFDVVIAEAKSGAENRPNKAWRDKNDKIVQYVVRFVGFCESEDQIARVSSELSSRYSYEDEKFRYRYIVFSREPNEHYKSSGVTYVTYSDAVRFLVEVRGECWLNKNIGVASVHYQWNPLINRIFEIANTNSRSIEERCSEILKEIVGPSGSAS
jgi:hypothetical protein